jgi:hypothetical protein
MTLCVRGATGISCPVLKWIRCGYNKVDVRRERLDSHNRKLFCYTYSLTKLTYMTACILIICICMYVYSRGGPPTAPAPRPSLIYCACILIITSCPLLSHGTRDSIYVKTITLGKAEVMSVLVVACFMALSHKICVI